MKRIEVCSQRLRNESLTQFKYLFRVESSTADYISLNPEFNALLAPQLSSPDRWVSGLINQLGFLLGTYSIIYF